MFKRIVIKLSGPICTCEVQDLSWALSGGFGVKHSLVIQCNTCQTSLHVGPSKFVAAFDLEVDYPGKPTGAKVLSLVQSKDSLERKE